MGDFMATLAERKVFIVRLWPTEKGQWVWHGEVQDVLTGQTQRIETPGQLLDRVWPSVAVAPPPAPKGLK
jgi:hypothetical protein